MLKETAAVAQLIQSYARAANLRHGRQLHCHLISTGAAASSIFISNHLLTMYAKCRDLTSALSLFGQMSHRNLVSWTALISALYQKNKFVEAARTFSLLHSSGLKPSQFSLSAAIQASSTLRTLVLGTQLHALSMKLGFHLELFVSSNLADMYSKCGQLDAAGHVFEAMPEKDEVAWTTMIDGYAKSGDFDQAFQAFNKLLAEETAPVDQHVLCSVLHACGAVKNSRQGKVIHCMALKMGFGLEEAIGNALIDMFSKSRDMETARSLLSWNVMAYSSLIDGYIEMEQIDKAVEIFVEAKRRGIEPNEFTYSSLIKAGAFQAVPEQGTQLHAQVVKAAFVFDPFISAALVDMYGKCGLLPSAIQIFEEIKSPNDFTWNSIIGVLAQHGRGTQAIEFFNQMVLRGISPNNITFINLLTACSHSGLVDQGLEYFDSMSKIHGVEPRDEHYSCVIDLLARAGRLKEAGQFISKMPVEPNAFGWCSLLGACRIHGAKRLGELAADKLTKLEPENTGHHVLLSSIYASAEQWEDVKAMRKLTRYAGVKKLPGISWVNVGNKAHVFGAQDYCEGHY